MTNQITRQEIEREFREAVLMALYPECESYEEAVKIEFFSDGYIGQTRQSCTDMIGLPTTLSRVLQALNNVNISDVISDPNSVNHGEQLKWSDEDIYKYIRHIGWQLLTDSKQTTTEREQTTETLIALTELLKHNQE